MLEKEFFFSISAGASQKASLNADILSIKLFSDDVEKDNQVQVGENENLKEDNEESEMPLIFQDQIKKILLLQA